MHSRRTRTPRARPHDPPLPAPCAPSHPLPSNPSPVAPSGRARPGAVRGGGDAVELVSPNPSPPSFLELQPSLLMRTPGRFSSPLPHLSRATSLIAQPPSADTACCAVGVWGTSASRARPLSTGPSFCRPLHPQHTTHANRPARSRRRRPAHPIPPSTIRAGRSAQGAPSRRPSSGGPRPCAGGGRRPSPPRPPHRAPTFGQPGNCGAGDPVRPSSRLLPVRLQSRLSSPRRKLQLHPPRYSSPDPVCNTTLPSILQATAPDAG